MHPARRASSLVLLLVVALPLATLVAGGWTLALIGGEGLDTVTDPVRRTAQVQQVDQAADRNAAQRGLSGELRRTAQGLAVQLAATGPGLATGPLLLRLEHPLDARRDIEFRLEAGNGRWTGPGFDVDPAWRVALSPIDGEWRLVGRWSRGGDVLRLEPAIPAAPDMAHGAR